MSPAAHHRPTSLILALWGVVQFPNLVFADVAPLPPPLKTALPEPFQVVAIGLGLSVLFVLLGSRFVANGALSRKMLNIVLFLIGMLTAITAVYSKKLRLDYKAEVDRARESYQGPVREPIESEPVPPSDDPPTVDPPAIDPPAIEAPTVDPPAVDPPEADPPNESDTSPATEPSE